MWWTAVFWFVYGVCSVLFLICLFKLGNSVANSPRTPVAQEVIAERSASPEAVNDPAALLDPRSAEEVSATTSGRQSKAIS